VPRRLLCDPFRVGSVSGLRFRGRCPRLLSCALSGHADGFPGGQENPAMRLPVGAPLAANRCGSGSRPAQQPVGEPGLWISGAPSPRAACTHYRDGSSFEVRSESRARRQRSPHGPRRKQRGPVQSRLSSDPTGRHPQFDRSSRPSYRTPLE
jgi:hypothetical protein